MLLTVRIYMDYVWNIKHETWSMEIPFISNKLILSSFLYWFHGGFCKHCFIFQCMNPINLVFGHQVLLVSSPISIIWNPFPQPGRGGEFEVLTAIH